jgi:hypothetical protein
MKYFTSDLWIKINSNNKNERNLAEEQWDKNDSIYTAYFSEIKNKLPVNFLNTYFDCQGFHDYIIKDIYISNQEKQKDSLISLTINVGNPKKSFSIIYQGVEKYNIFVPGTCNWMNSRMSWGYTEFELLSNGLFKQNILCDMDSEIEIVFKNVEVKNN